jgi:menaquinone-dependent protoporphyrinogen oxidase
MEHKIGSKVLVAFGTKYGSTARVAEEIASALRQKGYQADVLDLRSGEDGDPGTYDLVIVGSSIIGGAWSPAAEEFLDRHRDALSTRRVALFACCGDVMFDPDHLEAHRQRYLVNVAARAGIASPCGLGLFGGVLDFGRYGFLLKPFLNGRRQNLERRGVDLSKPYDLRDWETIREWAGSLA